MADCGIASVGTCLNSLFIMKHNCLENLGHTVFSDESSDLNGNNKCLNLVEKDYFSSSVKLDPSEDTVLDACKNAQDSSDSAISSLDSPLEDSDDSSESSDSYYHHQFAYKENVRFPSDKRPSFISERICRWADCVDHISSSTKLIEHLQNKHVNPQTFSETFICLWNGCKVFGRPSCSRTWLERHVLSHGGNKPYRCIVESCGQRFSSQLMLERHINQHFKVPKNLTDGVVDTTPKLIRRNGQKLRYRRQPFSARGRTDVFDVGTMAHLQYLLVQMAQRSKSVSLNVMDSRTFLHITFQPKVIGCRQEIGGEMKYLIRWYPYNALEDEWLPKSEAENDRQVPIWKLPTSVQQLYWESVFPNQRSKPVHQSRKYKPEASSSSNSSTTSSSTSTSNGDT